MAALAPLRQIVNARLPDPRKPYIRDYALFCGHVLVHRILPRDPKTKRMYVPTQCRCPHCKPSAPTNTTKTAPQVRP